MQSCKIVIPIFNEEKVIHHTLEWLRETIRQIAGFKFEIICVNDGSTDQTAEILKKESGITVITHDVNRGYGAALRTALDYCEADWVFILDADGTYPLEDLGRLIAEINESSHPPDMVIGARSGPGISSSPLKRFARWILRKIVYYLAGTFVPDLNSGMRIFRHSLYAEFRHLLPMGFSFTTTLTVASLYSGYRLKYIPIHYEKRVGQSNIKPVQDFIWFVILIIRLASYFEPLRFFLPTSMIILIVAVCRIIRDIWLTNAIGALSVVLVFSALQIFVIGVLADVIVRRTQILNPNRRLPYGIRNQNINVDTQSE